MSSSPSALVELQAEFLAGLAASTARAYRRDLVDFTAWCERRGVSIPTASQADLHAFLEDQLLTRTQTTVAGTESTLRSFFRYLKAQGVETEISVGPRRISPRDFDPTPDLLSPVELASILEASREMPQPIYATLVSLFGLQGLAVREVIRANVADLRHQGGYDILVVRRREVDVPSVLASTTAEALRWHVAGRRAGPLVLSFHGDRITRDSMGRALRRVARAVGLDGELTPRRLRVSMQSVALAAGVSPIVIQEATGSMLINENIRRLARVHQVGHAGHAALQVERLLLMRTTTDDLMGQVSRLLHETGVTPVAPVLIAAAVLESTLRTAAHTRNLALAGDQSIMAFANPLKSHGVISRSEHRQIEAWGDLRNDVAHGRRLDITIEEATDFAEGVALFIRRLREN